MMDILFEIAVLFGCVLLAGGVVLFWKNPLHKRSALLLSFSGAYLLGLCLLHLLPFLFKSELSNPGLWIVGGFFIQIFLEFFSEGVEHGHFHHEEGNKNFPWTIMIGLCLHAFFEGMPFGAHEEHQHSLLAGIVLHKIPVAIVLSGMFLSAGFSTKKALILLLTFAAMSPLGAIVYQWIEGLEVIRPEVIAPAVNALLVGILLHVATTILFETSDGHRFNFIKFLTIVLGVALAYFS